MCVLRKRPCGPDAQRENIMNFFGKLGRRAFTLAELMAVVIIVAIIAGIGFGSYRKAVERAKFTDGLSGAHTLAAAYDTYYYDHNYTYPTAFSQMDVTLTGASLSGLTAVTPNFRYSVSSNMLVAQRIDGDYEIRVPLETTGVSSADRCVGTNTQGQDFCESMGYSCGSGDEKC